MTPRYELSRLGWLSYPNFQLVDRDQRNTYTINWTLFSGRRIPVTLLNLKGQVVGLLRRASWYTSRRFEWWQSETGEELPTSAAERSAYFAKNTPTAHIHHAWGLKSDWSIECTAGAHYEMSGSLFSNQFEVRRMDLRSQPVVANLQGKFFKRQISYEIDAREQSWPIIAAGICTLVLRRSRRNN